MPAEEIFSPNGLGAGPADSNEAPSKLDDRGSGSGTGRSAGSSPSEAATTRVPEPPLPVAPGRPHLGREELGAELVRLRGHDRKAADALARRRAPALPQTRQRHEAAASERDRVGLLARRGFLSIRKFVDRHQAAALPERLAESGLRLDALGLGVDVGEADLVLGPERHQSPAHHLEAALPVLPIVTHDRQRIGRGHVPARRDIRHRPLGRDPEGELDLADVGGETGAATHQVMIAQPPALRPQLLRGGPAADLDRRRLAGAERRNHGVPVEGTGGAEATHDRPGAQLPEGARVDARCPGTSSAAPASACGSS